MAVFSLGEDRFRQYTLVAKATVGGETVSVRMQADANLYDQDETARKHIDASLREALIRAVLEKWTPVIKVYAQ